MLNRVRGTRDILESEARTFNSIISSFKSHTSKAGYNEIILPSLEDSSLYLKSLGSLSDIITKELFYIKDQSYVLRPEGTAGAIRAYLMSTSPGESKLWSYCGSMFRHERPQSGRYREFYQFGIENISQHQSGLADAEVITIASDILKDLQVDSTLHLNTLGDLPSRNSYVTSLARYFEGKSLSDLSKKRLEQGHVLRILDSKEEEDQECILAAPSIVGHLSESSLRYYGEVRACLDALKVQYVENHRLVRGLDYYTNVCFEFEHRGKAVIGGGRYDNLGKIIGGKREAAGIGWAAGIDRISEAVKTQHEERAIAVVPVGMHNSVKCLEIAREIRRNSQFVVKLRSDAESLKQHMTSLKKYNPKFIVFVGDHELENLCVAVKNCKTGEQKTVKIEELMKNPTEVFNI